jgi:hypothetical protein
MAIKILINAIRIGGIGQLWPGSSYDDIREAGFVASITASGGMLVDNGDAIIAAATVNAVAVRGRAGPVSEAESIMQTAVQESQAAAISDANAVAPTTTTMLSATTGVTTQNAGAATLTRGVHETFVYAPLWGDQVATVQEDTAAGIITAQPTHARTLDVSFPVGWAGGNVTIDGIAPDGTVQQEIYTSTPDSLVPGTKAFATVTAVTNGTLAGTVDVATVYTGAQLGVGGPVDAFLFMTVDGVREAFAASSAANGTFSPTTALDGTQLLEAWYSQVDAIANHTHTITDPGHLHTGVAHTHTLT